MIIQKKKVVSFTYTLSKESGEVVDSSKDGESISYIHGSGSMLPGIEKALEGQETGYTFDGPIEPSDAYGDYIPENVMPVPRAHIDHLIDQMEEGKVYKFDTGGGKSQLMKVLKIEENIITMDANHPLAGETIRLQCEVKEVRDATEAELASIKKKGCGCGSKKKSGGGCCSSGGKKEKSSGCGSGCGCK